VGLFLSLIVQPQYAYTSQMVCFKVKTGTKVHHLIIIAEGDFIGVLCFWIIYAIITEHLVTIEFFNGEIFPVTNCFRNAICHWTNVNSSGFRW
jgi:hypothetical protein